MFQVVEKPKRIYSTLQEEWKVKLLQPDGKPVSQRLHTVTITYLPKYRLRVTFEDETSYPIVPNGWGGENCYMVDCPKLSTACLRAQMNIFGHFKAPSENPDNSVTEKNQPTEAEVDQDQDVEKEEVVEDVEKPAPKGICKWVWKGLKCLSGATCTYKHETRAMNRLYEFAKQERSRQEKSLLDEFDTVMKK